MEPINVTCHGDRTDVALEGVLDVARVRAGYSMLDRSLRKGLPIDLYAEKLERVDAAGIQLLVAFCRAARELGLAVRWKSVSETLRSSSSVLGVTNSLELPT